MLYSTLCFVAFMFTFVLILFASVTLFVEKKILCLSLFILT